MLRLPHYTNKDLAILLWTISPFTLILNSIIFGSDYFAGPGFFLLATFITFLVLAFSFLSYGNAAVVVRDRFPGDSMFLRRAMILISLFLLMSALLLVALFSIFAALGMLEGNYENKFTWAFVTTGILNIFITFLSEAVSNFERWKHNMKETEQLKMAYKQSQLIGLKSQINPHVLFNSLNSLSGLIQEDTEKAERFLDQMSKVYRYMLRNEEEQLVALSTELQFLQSYFSLLKARYNEAIDLRIEIREEDREKKLPPLSLQVIIENALFQNMASRTSPLVIRISSGKEGELIITNNIQQKLGSDIPDYEAGLDNLVKKYQLMNRPAVLIEETKGERRITIPLIVKDVEETV